VFIGLPLSSNASNFATALPQGHHDPFLTLERAGFAWNCWQVAVQIGYARIEASSHSAQQLLDFLRLLVRLGKYEELSSSLLQWVVS
jgi:hypothetical protein